MSLRDLHRSCLCLYFMRIASTPCFCRQWNCVAMVLICVITMLLQLLCWDWYCCSSTEQATRWFGQAKKFHLQHIWHRHGVLANTEWCRVVLVLAHCKCDTFTLSNLITLVFFLHSLVQATLIKGPEESFWPLGTRKTRVRGMTTAGRGNEKPLVIDHHIWALIVAVLKCYILQWKRLGILLDASK